MAWQPTKPLAADQLSNSQSDLQGNFTELDTWSKVNHEPINSGAAATSGMHKYVTLTPQGIDPMAPLTTVNYFNIWNKNVGGFRQLVIRKGGGILTPFTSSSANNGLFGADGFSYLTSGVLLKWGTNGAGTNPIDVNANPPVVNFVSTIQLTNVNNNIGVLKVTNIPAAGGLITITSTTGNFQCMWFATCDVPTV